MDFVAALGSRSLESRRESVVSRNVTRSKTSEYGSLTWTFDPNNHYLHPKLVAFVYDRTVVRIVGISCILFLSMVLVQLSDWSILLWSFTILSTFLWIPFLILIILSFNRDASHFIVRSPEFWIKVIWSISKAALEIVRYEMNAWMYLRDDHNVSLRLGRMTYTCAFIYQPLVMIGMCFVISFVSLFGIAIEFSNCSFVNILHFSRWWNRCYTSYVVQMESHFDACKCI